MTAKEVVVRIGFEGGSLTLWRTRDLEGPWRYAVATDESALEEMDSDDEDEEDGEVEVEEVEVSTSEWWVGSFDAGMDRLNSYPWRQGYPREVHPDYRLLLWEHVIGKRVAPSTLERWAEICDVSVDRRDEMLADWTEDE